MISPVESVDLAIVGAGAAGLAAAIFAAETAGERRIVVLEGAAKIGAKILISGGGRCNVTHDQVGVDDFNGARNIVRNVLAAFDEKATVGWFEALGVRLKREETGKLFPVSDRARTVLDALLNRAAALGVQIRCAHRVVDIQPQADKPTSPQAPKPFLVVHQTGAIAASKVILATGGRSLPRTGSDGGGWEMVQRLGHSVTDTYPALVPLVLDAKMFHAGLSGTSQEVELSTFADDKLIDRRTGSLLWTHFGISGPVVMDASRHWTVAKGRGQRVAMTCNFLPGFDFAKAEAAILAASKTSPRRTLLRVLNEWLSERPALALLAHCGIDGGVTTGQLTRDARRKLVHALIDLTLPITHDRGWDYAEVTAGGVPLNEIDYRTMESRQLPGLYLIGELLDCDGRIGGYNFQWAWSTGHLAGRAAARAL